MMNLGIKDLEKLLKKDKVVYKYMSEIERVNENPEFHQYMSWEEDQRKIQNSLREEYREEGVAEGRTEEKKETAKKMKDDGLDLQTIARYTNLTIDEITRL